MNQICEKNKCTGCWACFNRCPKQSISMQIGDSLGHLYPVIDQNSCIDCGACIKICPANNQIEKTSPLIAFAGWDKNSDEYKSSTSGGAASALSRYIIRSGGVVYGCAMLSGIEVRHIRIHREEDLYKLKGSKYVQSNIYLAYHDALRDLKEGRKVLFIGTPCQVAAMKKFAERCNENLYTVDLICHGVPSLNLLQNHVKSKIGHIDNVVVKFRNNTDMCLQIQEQKKSLLQTLYSSNLWTNRYEDIFFNTFIDGFTYREICHFCKYATPMRIADLTIGDFWGLGKELPFLNEHPYGCSVLLPLTDKGKELINGIRKDFYLYERPVTEAINGNNQLQHPFWKTRMISLFLQLHSFIGINTAYRLCTIDKRLNAFFYRKSLLISLKIKKLIS